MKPNLSWVLAVSLRLARWASRLETFNDQEADLPGSFGQGSFEFTIVAAHSIFTPIKSPDVETTRLRAECAKKSYKKIEKLLLTAEWPRKDVLDKLSKTIVMLGGLRCTSNRVLSQLMENESLAEFARRQSRKLGEPADLLSALDLLLVEEELRRHRQEQAED